MRTGLLHGARRGSVHEMLFDAHGLMQYTDDLQSSALLSVEDQVTFHMQGTISRADVFIGNAQYGKMGESLNLALQIA